MSDESGRRAQKLRTRGDLLAAARALIDKGDEINVTAVADAAGISRATAYRYFPDPAALAMEAVLDGMVAVPDFVIPADAPVRERVHAVRRYWISFYRASENRLRIFAARAMEPGPDGAPRYRRVARRLPMFMEALAGARLGEKKRRELALALAATSGFENYVLMKDVLGFDAAQIEAFSETIQDALLEKYAVA